MKPCRRFLPPAVAAAAITAATCGLFNNVVGVANAQDFVCDVPTSGCTNGMFNQAKCECECISPFCHDNNGDCTNPSNNCGDNPWATCTRGVNCPWWVNPLKDESCTTGPKVPLGLWKIFNTRAACCNSNFAYSTSCDESVGGDPPTKHPTIAVPDEDDFEVIPIKFDIMGLPEDVKMRDLKDEMMTVLKRILIQLSESISGLKISDIEEKVMLNRNLRNADSPLVVNRALQKDVTLYFSVMAIRDEGGKNFGPIIIQEMRNSFDEILGQIQKFTDTTYFNADVTVNLCTIEGGEYDLCVSEVAEPKEIASLSPPSSVRAPAPVMVQYDSGGGGEGGGLASWAVALIVMFVLLLLGCIGYFIFMNFFYYEKDNDDGMTQDVQNNIYLNDEKSFATGRSRGTSQGSKSRARHSRQAVVEGDLSHNDGSSVTSYRTNKTSRREASSVMTDRTNKKQGRDPTSFTPGQENKPDPTMFINGHSQLMITDGTPSVSGGSSRRSRQYTEDPPLKPKRDPTMFVNGQYSAEDPPLKPKRDPTMFVDGHRDPSMSVDGQRDPPVFVEGSSQRDPIMFFEGRRDPSRYSEGTSIEEVYNQYTDDLQRTKGGIIKQRQQPFGMEDIDEDEEFGGFDLHFHNTNHNEDLPFNSAGESTNNYWSEEGSCRVTRDPTYYVDGDASSQGAGTFRTTDPSISSKSVGAKSRQSSSRSSRKSTNSDTSERRRGRGEGRQDNVLRKSLQSLGER